MENQPQQMQLAVDPNVYTITNANILFNEEDFHIAFTSGAQVRQFSASPKHAKRLFLLLKQQIEAYEKQFGELKTQLPKAPQMTQEEKTKLGF